MVQSRRQKKSLFQDIVGTKYLDYSFGDFEKTVITKLENFCSVK